MAKKFANVFPHPIRTIESALQNVPDSNEKLLVSVYLDIVKSAHSNLIAFEESNEWHAKSSPETDKSLETAVDNIKRLSKIFSDLKPGDDAMFSCLDGLRTVADQMAEGMQNTTLFSTYSQALTLFTADFKHFSETVKSLQKTSELVNQFATTTGTQALGFQFQQDMRSHRTSAYQWLALTVMAFIATLVVVLWGLGSISAYLNSLEIPKEGANTFLAIAIAPRVALFFICIAVTLSLYRLFLSHLHLSTIARNKQNLAEVVSFVSRDADPATRLQHHHKFFELIITQGETGFLSHVKENTDAVKGILPTGKS